MKKLLLFLLCAVMLVSLASCSSGSEENDTVIEATEEVTEEPVPEEPEYEFIEGTEFPTLDSVFPEVGLVSYDKYPIYGPFSSETNCKAAMLEYAKILEDLYGYSFNNNSYDSAAINVNTNSGTLIIYGTELTGTGYVIGLGLPE